MDPSVLPLKIASDAVHTTTFLMEHCLKGLEVGLAFFVEISMFFAHHSFSVLWVILCCNGKDSDYSWVFSFLNVVLLILVACYCIPTYASCHGLWYPTIDRRSQSKKCGNNIFLK